MPSLAMLNHLPLFLSVVQGRSVKEWRVQELPFPDFRVEGVRLTRLGCLLSTGVCTPSRLLETHSYPGDQQCHISSVTSASQNFKGTLQITFLGVFRDFWTL